MVSWRGWIKWCAWLLELVPKHGGSLRCSGALWVSWGREARSEICFSCFCCYLSALSPSLPSCCGISAQKSHTGAGRKTTSVKMILWITEVVLRWPLSGCGALYTAVSGFLGARKSIGATDLCWKNMWCLEQEQHLSCQHYQRRMKLNWNVQAFLVISGSLTFYSAPLRKELCGWISLSWMG